MDGSVKFLPGLGFFLCNNMNKESAFPYLYSILACKLLCFPPRKCLNRRNESTIDNF